MMTSLYSFSSATIIRVAFTFLTLVILSACGDSEKEFDLPPELTGITISPSSLTLIDVGGTQQFTAEGTFSDGSVEDITELVVWSSSDAGIAAVDNGIAKGLVTANDNDFGQVTITASSSGETATATVDVGACGEADPVVIGFRISPSDSLSLNVGQQRQFTSEADYCAGAVVTLDRTSTTAWTSDLETTITVDPVGLAEAVDVGNARISGSFEAEQATTLVTVGGFKFVQIAPGSVQVAEGLQFQLSANAIRSNNTREGVTESSEWASADPAIATVGNTTADKGLVTGGTIDGTTISSVKVLVTATATDENGTEVVGRRQVEVLNVTLTDLVITAESGAADADLPLGLTRQYVATGTFTIQGTSPAETFQQELTDLVTWSSDCVALSIGEETGLATGDSLSADDCPTPIFSPDTDFALVSAEIDYDGSTVTADPVEVSVIGAVLVDGTLEINTDDGSEVAVGLKMQFTATGDFTDGQNRLVTSSVDWTVSDAAIASIAESGGEQELTGLLEGAVNVEANYTLPTENSTQGEVTYPVTVTGKVITKVNIQEPDTSLAKGVPFAYTAMAEFSDGSDPVDITADVVWESSDTTVAEISNAEGAEGNITSKDCACPFDGDTTSFSTTITATSENGVVSDPTRTFTVTAATLVSLEISPDGMPTTVLQGRSVALTATATFTDETTAEVTTLSETTWTSADSTIASVGNAGNTKGVVIGELESESTVVITASYTHSGATETGTVDMKVLPPFLEAIFVDNQDDSGSLTVQAGSTIQLRVTAFFEDGTEEDVSADTEFTAYSSNNDAIATVNATGEVTGVSAGTVTFDISYTSGGVTESSFPQITVE